MAPLDPQDDVAPAGTRRPRPPVPPARPPLDLTRLLITAQCVVGAVVVVGLSGLR